MRLREEHPTDVVNRALALEDVYRNYDLADVKKINPRFVETAYDEEDKEIMLLNLEYGFFEAPLPEVKFLIEKLYLNRKIAESKDDKLENLEKAMLSDAENMGIPPEEAKKAFAAMIMKKD